MKRVLLRQFNQKKKKKMMAVTQKIKLIFKNLNRNAPKCLAKKNWKIYFMKKTLPMFGLHEIADFFT